MKLLVLGGTLFLGRHVVETALADGHEVTLFHRGRTNPELFPDAERVLGDRDGGLAPLAGREFDAVIDTCGYVPRVVGASAQLLADACGHYVFVSTGSVYAPPLPPGADETHAVAPLDDPANETVTGASYGPLKAACERAVTAAFGSRATIARAGLIVGPYDPTDRFTYWPKRLAQGGDVLCPPDPAQPVQWIDVRDFAAWLLHCAHDGIGGTFNSVGPAEVAMLGPTLTRIAAAVGGGARLHWAPAAILERHEIAPWMGLPLWVGPDAFGMLALAGSRARAAGLRARPVEETAADVLAWAEGVDRPARAGITGDVEAAALADALA